MSGFDPTSTFGHEHDSPAADDDFERFLAAPEHAWWAAGAQEGVEDHAGPAGRHDEDHDEDHDDRHDVDDSGISFEPDDPDPYGVLRAARDASWDDIVASYRRQVRWWHPDGLGEASDVERTACDDRIRQLNAAYQELQLRRGR